MPIFGVVGPLRGFEWMKKGVEDDLTNGVGGGEAEIRKDGKRNGCVGGRKWQEGKGN